MTLTRLVVLANSWKHHDYCLAGVDLATGRWVRPVTALEDGRVRRRDMKLGGHFPRLLDVLDVPLDETGPDFGFESENRTILPGRWHRRGRWNPEKLLQYVERPRHVLHNHKKYVTPTELQAKPFQDRVTLQLIRVDRFEVRDFRKQPDDKPSWKGSITSGRRKLDLSITDPAFAEKLNSGYEPAGPCLLTMSLGMPYKPPFWREDEELACWKLIAGVIELEPGPSSERAST